MKKVLWWLILGTRGGINRAKIIKKLKERPYNAHQLAEELNVNYRTVRHHIKILEDSEVVKSAGEKYGKMYFLSENMEKNYRDFETIWKQVQDGKKDN
ncbi:MULTISPECIES: ArsR/SmtB family transcription factor [Methanobacterium]|jgi:DNA-binding transcriptional ArsR family regulator|uniref:Winged helix-turn-helix domain-containing protein n=1 Tax=Methanobacterium veterum TaxID=408577 RepID=A0A9E5DNT7_9EURY|nr:MULTISPECIES: winged helix-turn-helix domain-containing protein [Methanobacterium]MCZ3365479.1 winged helix-turn-helix domain-containing protein [Methanobacterium veterum]MCZ3373231.1 winged helix-turn-helix domain-containing protein [Methanobacterium veterum]